MSEIRDLSGINPNAHAPAHPKDDAQSTPSSTQFPPLPEAPPSKVFGSGYSEYHPVPTVQGYKAEQKENERAADEYARIVAQRVKEQEERQARQAQSAGGGASGHHVEEAGVETEGNESKIRRNNKQEGVSKKPATEKERLMEQMNSNQQKPTDRFNKADHGTRRVRDPTTGGEIIVKDADPKDFDASEPRTHGSNVLYHPFPPARPASLDTLLSKLRLLQFGVAGGLFIVWLTVAFGSGIYKFVWRSIVCSTIGFCLMTAVSIVERGIDKEVERVRQDMGRQRGESFSPPFPESVEWLNGLVKLVWGLIDPAMFVPIADMVEDILQQSLPGFVDAVRITDLGQGTNPLRITSIRALPDQPGDDGYPKTSWIDQGNSDVGQPGGKEAAEDQAGDYYNFEVSFAYSALPGQGDHLREKNIHLLLEFFLGAFDWLHIPIPIWVQIEQIFGTVRLRVQFIPEAPFIRNLTFALVGVPAVEVSVTPMSRALPNLLNLPFISGFVKMGIAAGCAELSVPKSMTLNMQEMLSGAAVGDTRAIGVFAITIHHCEGLSAQDKNGKSDPYIVLAYAKFGKPLFSTRIIQEDLNPVFEETSFLLIGMDEVKAKEDLSAMLWDSDKMSADDLIGRVQIPVAELMLKPNQMVKREDKLMGFEDANEMDGKLVWSIGYFEKAPLIKELERPLTAEEKKAEPAAPTKSAPEGEMLPTDKAPNPAKKDLPPPPPDVQKTRPDPKWPSGVLSVIVHQINNLERQNLKGKSGEREGEAGQDTDEASEQSDNLPSGYAEIIINDEMIYKTRVKQYTTNPYFEAGTEAFIRDFRDTVVRVVVRDSRLREADPILGIVSVRLSEVFSEASSVTQVYAITEGVGFGKANISFAFRGVQTTLPKNLTGWNTGTLEISDVSAEVDASSDFDAKAAKLRIVTADSTEQVPKKEATVNGNTISWEIDQFRMPVYSRYQHNCVFELGKADGVLNTLGVKKAPEAIAVLWLQDLTDDVEQEVKLPILTGPNLPNLRQQAINDFTKKHHEFEVVGFLTVRLKLDSGLDADHEELNLKSSRRHALQAYDAIEGEAETARKQKSFEDDGVIDKHEKKEIDKAHKRQLENRGRGLMQLKPYRQAKWMAKGITDRLPGQNKTREPSVQTEA